MSYLSYVLIAGIIFFQNSTHAQDTPELSTCQCVGGIKDYDPAKGYYFDRVSGSGFSKTISARFSCSYTCKDSQNNYQQVSYIHEESHRGGISSGPEHAKWFICDNSIGQFIPHHDLMGKLIYYDTIAWGPFDASQGPRPEFKKWASQNCSQNQLDLAEKFE